MLRVTTSQKRKPWVDERGPGLRVYKTCNKDRRQETQTERQKKQKLLAYTSEAGPMQTPKNTYQDAAQAPRVVCIEQSYVHKQLVLIRSEHGGWNLHPGRYIRTYRNN